MEKAAENQITKTVRIYQTTAEENKYIEFEVSIDLNQNTNNLDENLYIKKIIRQQIYETSELNFNDLIANTENDDDYDYFQVISLDTYIKNNQNLKWENPDENLEYTITQQIQRVQAAVHDSNYSHSLYKLLCSGRTQDQDWGILDVHNAEFLGLSPDDYLVYIKYVNQDLSLDDYLNEYFQEEVLNDRQLEYLKDKIKRYDFNKDQLNNTKKIYSSFLDERKTNPDININSLSQYENYNSISPLFDISELDKKNIKDLEENLKIAYDNHLTKDELDLYVDYLLNEEQDFKTLHTKHIKQKDTKKNKQILKKNIEKTPQTLARNLIKVLTLSFKNFFTPEEKNRKESHQKIDKWLTSQPSNYIINHLKNTKLNTETSDRTPNNFQSAIKILTKIHDITTEQNFKLNRLYQDLLENNIENNTNQKDSRSTLYLLKRFHNFKKPEDIVLLKRLFFTLWGLNVIESQPYQKDIENSQKKFIEDLKSILIIPEDHNESIKFKPIQSALDEQPIRWYPPRIKDPVSRLSKLQRNAKQFTNETDILATRFVCESNTDALNFCKRLQEELSGERYKWLSVPTTANTASNRNGIKLLLAVDGVPTEIQIINSQKEYDQQEFNSNHHVLYREIIQDYLTRTRGGEKASKTNLDRLITNLIRNTNKVTYHGSTREEVMLEMKEYVIEYFAKYNSHIISMESITKGLKQGYENFYFERYHAVYSHLNHLYNYEQQEEHITDELVTHLLSLENSDTDQTLNKQIIQLVYKYIPQIKINNEALINNDYQYIEKKLFHVEYLAEADHILNKISEYFPKLWENTCKEIGSNKTIIEARLRDLIKIIITNQKSDHKDLTEFIKDLNLNLSEKTDEITIKLDNEIKEIKPQEWRDYFLKGEIPEHCDEQKIEKITARCKVVPINQNNN